MSPQEIELIARQLSISEGQGTLEEQFPTSWLTTAAEIGRALDTHTLVAKGALPATNWKGK